MRGLYTLAVKAYAAAVRAAAWLGHPKARLWAEGRRPTAQGQAHSVSTDPKTQTGTAERYVWFHAASLGEFEQGRPLIEALKAQRDYGIHFIRGRVSEVGEAVDGRVVVKAEDTLNGKPIKVTLDLLVLMAGIVCNPDAQHYAREIGVAVDDDGFLKSRNNVDAITESSRPGVFIAGSCTGAKTVPETLAEARSAALAIHQYLNKPR